MVLDLSPRNLQDWMRVMERRVAEAQRNGRVLVAAALENELGRIQDQIDKNNLLTPTAPIELTYQTALYLDPRTGEQRARLILDFPDVVKSTDGTDIEVYNYELFGRREGVGNHHSAYPGHLLPAQSFPGAPGTFKFTSALPPMVLLETSSTSSFRAEDFDPGDAWRFQVRANGGTTIRPGQWSAQLVVNFERDTIPPPQPTPPIVTAVRGVVIVEHDGQAVTGPMPADHARTELYHGEASSPTKKIHEFSRGGGTHVVSGLPYYKPQFFRLRAFDESGNPGPWSEQTVAQTTPLVDTDIILSEIDAAETVIKNAGTILLESGQDLQERLDEGRSQLEATSTALQELDHQLDVTFPETVNLQIEAAKQAAALDAQNKATAAQQAAINAAALDATAKAEQAEADAALDASTKANQALADAKQDAQNKANAAQQAAITAAAADATSKAEQAEADAAITAQQKADAALAAAKTDATAKAQAAEDAAIAAAAADATAKAEQAEANAAAAAALDAQEKADAAAADALAAAKTYADAEAAGVGADVLEAAKLDATQKANAAEQAAKDAAALDATAKMEQAEADAAILAQQKADAALAAAKTDASNKATAAEQAAIDAAAADATAKQQAAEAAAALDAKAKADAALAAAKADSTTKADAAEQAAINAAAADATAKAEAAEAAAAATAAADATAKADQAKADAIAAANEYARQQDEPIRVAAEDAQQAADTANAAASTAQEAANAATAEALAAAGLAAGKGRVWWEPAAPPAGTTHAWTGAANNSASVEQVEGIEVRRNLFGDPNGVSKTVTWSGGRWFGGSGGAGTYSWGSGPTPTGGTFRRKTWSSPPGGSNGDTGFDLNPWFNVTPGEIYTFSAYMRPSVGGKIGGGRLYYRTASGSLVRWLWGEKRELIANEWNRVHVTGTIPADAVSIQAMADIESGTLWQPGDTLDGTGALLELTDTLRPYFDGSSADDRSFDLWVDTDSGNTPHRWDSTTDAWVVSTDQRLIAAADAAAAAQADADAANTAAATAQSRADAAHTLAGTAESNAQSAISSASSAASAASAASQLAGTKADVLIQSTAPTAAMQKATTLWIDTTNNANTPKRWINNTWTGVTDKAATDAAAAAANVSKNLFSVNAPSGTAPYGSTWFRVNATGEVIGQWQQTAAGIASTWTSRPIRSEVISNLDVGKLTVGSATMVDAVAQHIAAQSGQFISLAVSQLTAGTGTMAVGVIDKIYADVVMSRKMLASQVLIGEGSNLVPNGMGEKGDKSGWAAGTSLTYDAVDTPTGVAASFRSAPSSGTVEMSTDGFFPVDGGGEYVVDVWLKADKVNSRINVELRNQTGAHASANAPVPGSSAASGAAGVYPVYNLVVPTVWTRYEALTTMDAGTTKARIGAVHFNSSLGTERTATVRMAVRVRSRVAGTLVAENSITAPKIVASEELTAKIAQFLFLSAGQIDVNDLFADTAVIGKIDALTAEFLTHTDGTGYRSVIDGQGMKVTYTDAATGEVSDRLKLGVFDEEYLGFTDDNNETSVSIDKYGGASFRDLYASDSFTYKGTELTEVLANLPRLVAWQSRLTNSTSFNNTRHWPFVRLSFIAEPMRIYRIHTTPLRALTNSTQANVKVFMKYRVGAPATTSSEHLTWSYMSAVNNVTTTFMMQGMNRLIAIGPSNSEQAGEWSILIAMATETSGSSATLTCGTDNPFVVWVEDCGPWMEQAGEIINGVSNTSADETVVSKAQNYDKTWSWTGVRSYIGTNATYAYNTSKGYQGLSPAAYGNLKSLWTFPSLTTELSGAAIAEIWVYFYFEHWFNNAGGTARIVLHGHSSVPSSYSSSILAITVPKWARGTGKWVKLPSSLYNGFKTGAYRGVGLEGNGTYETYGIANASRIRIKYSK